MRDRLTKIKESLEKIGIFTLLPPTSENKVLEFEEKHKIKLPEEYRLFITSVTEGITMDDGNQLLYSLEDAERILGEDKTSLSIPFFYTTSESEFILNKIKLLQPSDDFADFYYSKEMEKIRKAGCPDGCMILASPYGGNDFSVLVVNGEEYGKMWRTGEYDYPDYSAESGNFEPLSFLDWFDLLIDGY